MSILRLVYNQVFYRPLLNGLVFFTQILPFHDMGLAIIILTIIVKLVIFPFTHKSIKTQIKIKEIEPELKKIKKSFPDRQKQAEEMMRLYKEHGISPYSGFLMLFIQLPILIALFSVFRRGLNFKEGLYYFLVVPQNVNIWFLGFINITAPSVLLAAITGITQFLQVKLATPANNSAGNENKNDFNTALAMQMKYFMPILIFIIALKLPAAVSIYWTTMNIFAIVHESLVRRQGLKTL